MTKPANPQKILVGMSGGVDSSVSAALLKEQGHAVEGLFMKNWEEDDTSEVCTAAEDARDAQKVADLLGITLHKRNFSAEYWNFVFEDFLREYRAGRTPNPDILCNREIKFKTFLDHARDLGADKIATGHYVRSDEIDGRYRLLKGRDANKDQSYFLYTIGQEQLKYSVFPVGELEKPAVREKARQLQLAVHDKKDSTGICFIGEKRFQEFLSRYLEPNPGEIVSEDGKVIGRHNGLMYYTIGQRHGLGIGGVKNRPDQPWFVAAKDHHTNRLIAVQADHPLLYGRSLTAIQPSWVSRKAPATPLRCRAKTRYRQADQDCIITAIDGNSLQVVFDEPQRAMTPGQSVVFYQGDECLGGAIINETDRLNSRCELR
jgi:tRNA-specific 2-thiouridylase